MPPHNPLSLGETLVVRTEQDESAVSYDRLQGEVKDLGVSVKLTNLLVTGVLILLVLELGGVVVDLFQDRNTYGQAVSLNLAMQERINKLEGEIAIYRKEIIDREIILECLRIRKYWEYPDCFSR